MTYIYVTIYMHYFHLLLLFLLVPFPTKCATFFLSFKSWKFMYEMKIVMFIKNRVQIIVCISVFWMSWHLETEKFIPSLLVVGEFRVERQWAMSGKREWAKKFILFVLEAKIYSSYKKGIINTWHVLWFGLFITLRL